NSNTQYAVLGLYAGRQAGATIDKEVWESIQAYYVREQQPDGGWIYSANYGNKGSALTMTVAGLSGLAMAADVLETGRRKLNPDGSYLECGKYPTDEPVRRGRAWLAAEDGAGASRF